MLRSKLIHVSKRGHWNYKTPQWVRKATQYFLPSCSKKQCQCYNSAPKGRVGQDQRSMGSFIGFYSNRNILKDRGSKISKMSVISKLIRNYVQSIWRRGSECPKMREIHSARITINYRKCKKNRCINSPLYRLFSHIRYSSMTFIEQKTVIYEKQRFWITGPHTLVKWLVWQVTHQCPCNDIYVALIWDVVTFSKMRNIYATRFSPDVEKFCTRRL